MRDQYIQLIKDYINKTPQYKNTLDELKKNVLIAGATEQEFEEALMEVESGEQNTNTNNPLNKLRGKKGVFAITSILFLILVPSALYLNSGFNNRETAETSAPIKTEEKNKQGTIPIVYANTTPIDAKKVFSIPSDNVKLDVTGKPKKEILGFFPYWMLENQDKIVINDLTSVALFGLGVNGKGEIVTVTEDGKVDPGWAMWRDEKLDVLIKRAKALGIKVSLTFKSFNNTNIENLSLSDEAQKTFVANASYLINSKNLDGVNIDFEYTGQSSDSLRDGFLRLIRNLNGELKRQNPDSVLTIDTYLVSGSEQGLFNLQLLSPHTDAFVIMGYDMHTPLGDPGPVSAMGGDTNVIGYVQNYLEKLPENKLILAVPYYGYDWPEKKDDQVSTKILPFAQINEATKNTQVLWNENTQTPYYKYSEDGIIRVVHFDNVRSLGIKYDFINSKNLKGVGIWALGYDGLNSELHKLLIDKFIAQ
ncbi:MAG: hypothetical protein COU25_01930 [Candidatus Levybacteria bacterium CG10_big_fil_rev_8_21_14_0_10_35_13]|nr:MAG: hypothetical protein COU25_01930 [Candidatus Levybacteria bacterium CG10_big_fil_rev_8_21_14_0_10_35_13]